MTSEFRVKLFLFFFLFTRRSCLIVRSYFCGQVIELVIKHRFKLLLPAQVKPAFDGATLSEIEMAPRGNYVQGREKMKSEVAFSLRAAHRLDQVD